LLASKFKSEQRKLLGWTLFITGLASTVPIAMHLFGKPAGFSSIQHTDTEQA